MARVRAHFHLIKAAAALLLIAAGTFLGNVVAGLARP
jgi:hypothetical protein